jgi:hypothetical protein
MSASFSELDDLGDRRYLPKASLLQCLCREQSIVTNNDGLLHDVDQLTLQPSSGNVQSNFVTL